MRRRYEWAGSIRRLIVLFCYLTGAALAGQEQTPPQPTAGGDLLKVETMVEAARTEARKFKNSQPQEPWESSAARKQLQALWDHGREQRMSAAGARATVETLEILHALGRHTEIVEKIGVIGIQEPVWAEVTWVLLQEAVASGNFDGFVTKAMWVAENTADVSLSARLWFTLGRVYREQGQPIEAEAAFRKAADLAPDPKLAASANGAIHEMWNLNAGLPAPAFAAQPLTGEPMSLEKLRGKVVILDFWGST